jgi:hypothetical protein
MEKSIGFPSSLMSEEFECTCFFLCWARRDTSMGSDDICIATIISYHGKAGSVRVALAEPFLC